MPSLKSPARTGLEGTRVLVVEDEMLVAANIAELLRELGCVPVGPVSNVELALAAINGSERIDCATLDVRLNAEISGSVGGALVAKGIPFVVCSAYQISLRDFKNIPILEKPFSKEQLKMGLEQALRFRPVNGRSCETAATAAAVTLSAHAF